MHRNVIFTFILIVYCIVATVGLTQFGAGLYASLLLLLGIPIITLIRYSAAPSPVIATVTLFGVGLSLLLEGAAYAYGLWYMPSAVDAALFGWLTFGMVVLTTLKALFLVLFYELLFDDGFYRVANARERLIEFGLFAVGAVLIIGVLNVMFNALDTSRAYYWLTIALLLSSVAMLLVRRALKLRLVNKIATFVGVAAIPMLCVEWLLVANDFKIVTTSDNLVSLPFSGVALPLGEFLLALALPAFVITVYELYLDDRS